MSTKEGKEPYSSADSAKSETQGVALTLDPAHASWEKLEKEMDELMREGFGDNFGTQKYIALAKDPKNVVVENRSTSGRLIGFSIARIDTDTGLPNVDLSVIAKAFRGQKRVGIILNTLEDELRKRGYKEFTRDVMRKSGYDKKIERHYGGRIVARVFAPSSPLVHYRISL